MSTFEEALGTVIATERKRLNMTQETLAGICGVHSTYISQLERGIKSPTVRVLRAIASALGKSAARLIRDAENR